MVDFIKFNKKITTVLLLIVVFGCAQCEEDNSFLQYLPSDLGSCPSSLNNIDQIYVINLDIRPEKWEKTRRQLENFNLKALRVSAINGWKMDRGLRNEISKRLLSWEALSDGQLGCFLSHITVLKDAFKKQYKCIWVLEDDIIALEDLRELDGLVEKMNVFDPEWDLLFTNVNNRINNSMNNPMLTFEMVMGPTFNYSLVTDPNFTPNENEEFRRIQYRLGTYSMIISKKGVQKLLESYQTHKANFPVDMQMHCCPNKRYYISKKEYVFYEKTQSDTGWTRNAD